MPQLDVSEGLGDSLMSGEKFTVIRRQQVVNNFGETTTQTQNFQVRGSITPARSELMREEAFQTQTKIIRVITSFRLRFLSEKVGGIQYQPDVVLWNGNHYLVRTLDDYSRYGQGFVQAECSSIDFVDNPPKEIGPQPPPPTPPLAEE